MCLLRGIPQSPKTVWLSWNSRTRVLATRVRFRDARRFSSDDVLRLAHFMTMLGVSGVELPDRPPHPVSSLRLGETLQFTKHASYAVAQVSDVPPHLTPETVYTSLRTRHCCLNGSAPRLPPPVACTASQLGNTNVTSRSSTLCIPHTRRFRRKHCQSG